MSRPAVFLDRDGVLVEEVFYPETGEQEAPLRAQDVRLTPDAVAARRLAEMGYALVVISNQGGYAKGKASLRELWLAHERFMALLAAQDVTLDKVFYSYGHPDGIVPHFSGPSLDRKPSPYNLLIAAAQLDLDLSQSWMIGDRDTDVTCAHAAGVRAILLRKSTASPHIDEPAIVVSNFMEAVQYIGGAEKEGRDRSIKGGAKPALAKAP